MPGLALRSHNGPWVSTKIRGCHSGNPPTLVIILRKASCRKEGLFTIGIPEEDRPRRWRALTTIALTAGLFPLAESSRNPLEEERV
jgi:hypothetical protein